MRSFITHHRAYEAEKLVVQAKTGLLSGKIKPVDYDSLRALAAEKRVAGKVALVKVKKLQDLSKFRKEQNVMKQHKAVWLKELVRLNSLAKRLQAEIDMFTDETAREEATKSVFADLEAYESNLSRDFVEFKKCTLDPVVNLRDDLKLWLQMTASTPSSLSPGSGVDNVQFDDSEQVKETLESVKKQQQKITERLTMEQRRLETELNITGIYDSSCPPYRTMQTGIPEEAFDLECPDLLLKTSVLQEFILIDGRYVEKLTELEREHYTVLNVRNGGWSENDHSLFLYVNDQYIHEVQNRRSLFIDCLRKHLPHKPRSDIVEHENWWMHFRFYFRRRHDLLCAWNRDRTELLNRAEVVFSEACRAKELQEERLESLQKQREFCEDLYSKVREWRENKMEMMRLEQEMANKRRREMEAVVAAEEERLKVKRQEQKDKIREFHKRVDAQKQIKEEKDRLRLEELEQYLAEQAVYDKERVKFREEEIQRKEESRVKKQEEALAAREEKERILEAIRQKVRPHVEGDLLRLWSDTLAWQARQKSENEVCLLKPDRKSVV